MDTLSQDSAFSKAVSVVGGHYPCHGNNGGDANSCPTPPGAVGLGKPLWMSEGGSQDYNTGAGPWIRSIVRGYVDGSLTGFINWPVVAAIYPSLKFATTGLVLADQPWSGTYTVGKSLWVNAQVTQFTQPGWTFIKSASGYLGGNEQNGTYMTLKAPGKTAYSTILETSTASSVQTVDVKVTGGLPTGTVHVWSTNLGSGRSTDWFVQQRDVTPNGGTYPLTLQPDYIYSISTTSGQGRGTATGSGSGHLALPYSDSFAGYPVGGEARYLAQMQGDFQSRPCTGGRRGNCMRQMADRAPIFWGTNGPPRASLGDLGWSDYTVTVKALMEQSGVVYLAGRVGSDSRRTNGFAGYSIRVSDNGGWWLNENHTTGTQTTLAQGALPALGRNRWITLSMTFKGQNVSASINGKPVAAITSSTYSAGQIAIGVEGWQTDQFADLSITPGVRLA